MTRRTTTLLAALAILVLGALTYSNSLRGVFVFDDKSEIEENPAIRHLWPLGPILRGPRPVVDLTFALNYSLGRLHVTGYHLVNLAIHLLAALALFGIVRRTLRLPALAGRFDEAAASVLAFCAALIWMVHPLQTGAVTYIVQRAESLMGLFYLLTLYALIRAATSETATPLDRENAKARKTEEPDGPGSVARKASAISRRAQHAARSGSGGQNSVASSFAFSRFRGQTSVVVWSVAAVAACALGMGCKEVMVTAPAALLLYDRAFIAGSFREALRRRWGSTWRWRPPG